MLEIIIKRFLFFLNVADKIFFTVIIGYFLSELFVALE